MDLNIIFKRLDNLIEQGWKPCINVLENGLWHCSLTHKDLPPCDYKEKIVNGVRELRLQDHPLRINIRNQKTMSDAIILACDIAEIIDVEEAINFKPV